MAGTAKEPKRKSKTSTFKELCKNFEKLVHQPDQYLEPQPKFTVPISQFINQIYEACISSDVDKNEEIPTKIVLDQMDDEQIWQQLEIRNGLVMDKFLKHTAQFIAMGEQNLGIELDDDDEELNELLSEEEIEESVEEDEEQRKVENFAHKNKEAKAIKAQKTKTKKMKSGKSSVVDDRFFKLDEMKAFLEQEEIKEMRKQKKRNTNDDADMIDHFAEDFGVAEDSNSNNSGENANFADFFDIDDDIQVDGNKLQGGTQKDFFNESDSDHDDEQEIKEEDDIVSEIDETDFVSQSGVNDASDSEQELNADELDGDRDTEQSEIPIQSSNDMREARLLQRIRDYEDVVLGEKPWQLKGEVHAANRPQNSLLEEILEFDSSTRPSAPITDEQNQTIEDIIKRRIRDRAWDDVERTVRPDHTPQEYRKQLVLDQEKSKKSLAQIYEQQYQEELDKVNPNLADNENSAQEPQEHQEIKRAMHSLFLKLDSLSNFHFTPKPVAPEAKIVTNTPAVHMEEVAPLVVSDAKLLAPEEVFRGPKHTLIGKSERTRTDKNRERRKKKQKQRAINSALQRREQQRVKEGKGSTQREAKAKLLKSITKSRNVQTVTTSNEQSALKSSKAFFNKLQDKTSNRSTIIGNKRPKTSTSKIDAKKLKL